MRAHLIRIDARDELGAAVALRLASVDDHRLCHVDAAQWTPAIARLPVRRYDFFGGDFRGAITTPSATFAVATDGIDGFAALRFAGARFRYWKGELGDPFSSFTLAFDGQIRAEPGVAEGLATFTAGPDDDWLDKPLLGLFAGTGGLEGPDDLEGTVKPLALGQCRFAPGTLIDPVDLVWRISGHGAIQAVTAAYDRVASLGASSGNYADLAALLAASVPEGGWATCHAQGLVRLGAPPDGQVSFDVQGDNAGAGGYASLPGEMIGRLVELAGGTANASNLAALDTARPWPLGLVLTSQTTARSAIQQIADSVIAVAGLSWTGKLFVQPLGFTTATLTLAADGSALPPVGDVSPQPVGAPFWRLATEAEASWVVHDPASVATGYTYRGEYSAARVYRLDDMVAGPDGASWAYIDATPGAGHALPAWPTTSNTWWENVSPPASQSVAAKIRQASIKNFRDASNVARKLLTATDAGTTATISVARHDWDYPEGTADVTRALGTITGQPFDTTLYVYFDDGTLANGSPSYQVTTDPLLAQNSNANPYRHPVGMIRTPTDGGADTEGGIGPNYGYGPLTDAVANFGGRLERLATTPPVPTIATDGSAVEHNANKLGVALRLAWTLSTDNEKLIHGFEVMLYQSASSAAYTPNTTPLLEQRTLVGPKTRGLVAAAIDATAWYTWAIRSYRNVDQDVDATGRLYSAWVKPSLGSENPYQPSTSAELADSVKIGSGGHTASDVSTWAGYASAGLNSDGTVRDDKVGSGALIDYSLLEAGWAVQTSTVGMTNETYDMLFGAVQTTSGPRLVLRANFVFRFVVANPAQDTTWSFEVKGLIKQTVGAMIPSVTATAIPRTDTWLWASRTGTFYTGKQLATLEWVIDGQTPSTYQPGLRFIVPAGTTVEVSGPHYVLLQDKKVRE